jgi:TonB family protein
LAVWTHAAIACAVFAAAAQSQPEQRLGADRPIAFDIPAQPIATAMEAFSSSSGYQLLVADIGPATSRSVAIQGVFLPRDALARMISGAGLDVRYTAERAAVVLRSDRGESMRVAALPRAGEAGFDTMLQRDVMLSLCDDPVTRPGRYRAVLDVWVESSGRIDRAELLSTTGDPERDRQIVAALGTLRSVPPPPGLAQPVTLMLLPKVAGATLTCEALASFARRGPAR